MKTTRLHSRARSDSPGAGQAGCLYFWAESLLKHRALMMRAMYIRALSAPAFSELCRGFVGVFKGVFKGYSPCIPPRIPQPRNRYLYHFIGADTKKHRNFDTMGIRIEVFFFCLKALGTRAFGLLRYLLLPSRTIARRHYSSHESRVAVSYRLFLWLPFNLWAIVCSSTFAPLQEVKFL